MAGMEGFNQGHANYLPKDDTENSSEKIEELKISPEEGNEALENLDIIEKNEDLLQKSQEIENELKKHYAASELNPDTGEPKSGAKSDFEKMNTETLKETRRELTRPSKYVKGAVISGLVAAGLYVDQAYGGPISNSTYEFSSDTVMNALQMTEMGAMIAAAGWSVRNGVKAVGQEIKSRVVSNQKVQRIVAMIAGGMQKKLAQDVVRAESRVYEDDFGMLGNSKMKANEKKFGYEPAGTTTGSYYDQGYDSKTGYFDGKNRPDYDIETIKNVRGKLDEMGIKRIDRKKYKG